MCDKITYEQLPEMVSCIMKELAYIRGLVEKLTSSEKERLPIGIDRACQLLGKAKPTVYALVRKRLLPCYKSGKKLYFFRMNL